MLDLLADLFDEYSAWYLGLAEEYGTLPRSISGINPNGEQFIYLLDEFGASWRMLTRVST